MTVDPITIVIGGAYTCQALFRYVKDSMKQIKSALGPKKGLLSGIFGKKDRNSKGLKEICDKSRKK